MLPFRPAGAPYTQQASVASRLLASFRAACLDGASEFQKGALQSVGRGQPFRAPERFSDSARLWARRGCRRLAFMCVSSQQESRGHPSSSSRPGRVAGGDGKHVESGVCDFALQPTAVLSCRRPEVCVTRLVPGDGNRERTGLRRSAACGSRVRGAGCGVQGAGCRARGAMPPSISAFIFLWAEMQVETSRQPPH